MSKREFVTKYMRLNARERTILMGYYMDVYKGAIFASTLADAEKRIRWMREVNAEHFTTPPDHSA